MRCAMASLREVIPSVLPTRPARLAAAGLIALAGLGLTGSAAAAARPPLKTVSATTQVDGPTGTLAKVTAHCPRGTRAVAGGYDPTFVFHPNGSGTALLVNTSRRLGPGAWKVTAYQLGGGDPVSLTAIANCSSELGRPKVRISQRSILATPNNPNPGNATAHCPHHYFAVAGGYHISVNGRSTNPSDSPPVSMVIGSRAVARDWAVTGARVGTGRSKMTAFAYCYPVRPLGRPKVGIMHQRSPVGIDQLITPRCPLGWYAVSGGYSARFPMGPGQGSSLPAYSKPHGTRRWSFGAVAVQGSNAPFNGFTYCLRRS